MSKESFYNLLLWLTVPVGVAVWVVSVVSLFREISRRKPNVHRADAQWALALNLLASRRWLSDVFTPDGLKARRLYLQSFWLFVAIGLLVLCAATLYEVTRVAR